MPAIERRTRDDEIARKWCALAERRLAHIDDLYRSGRWKHYYDEERFAECMADAIRAVSIWRGLAGRAKPDTQKSGLRPAA